MLAQKRFNSHESPAMDQFPNPIRGGQRLVVSVGRSASGLEKAVPGTQGDKATNVVAAVDGLARLPTRWEGYEGVNIVVISTSRPEVFENILPENARIEALEQWVRMGGTLVLCAGSQADAALHRQVASGKVRPRPLRQDRPAADQRRLGNLRQEPRQSHSSAQAGRDKWNCPRPCSSTCKARSKPARPHLPLVIRKPQGLGQVLFVAADLDWGPIRDWSDRPLLVAALLDLPVNPPADETANVAENYGYNDLAGQLRSALDVPNDVHLVPFSVVALLVTVYILLIGPGDYFLLRKLGFGMQWTWITFPTIVVLFAVGSYVAAYWLKGDQLRVSQIDLVDIDAGGTARGASWFSIFSPRGESFDLSMRPCLPDGQSPQQASASLAWFGKAGDEFNGMYGRNAQNSAPLWSQGYSIAPSLDSIRGVPIQVWASKSFTQRWLGRAADLGLDVALKCDAQQKELASGTITNRLKGSGPQTQDGVALSHGFLVYGDWVYVIGELQARQDGRRSVRPRGTVSLSTYHERRGGNFAAGHGREMGTISLRPRQPRHGRRAAGDDVLRRRRRAGPDPHGQRLPGLYGPQRSAQGGPRGPGGHAAARRLLPRRRLAPRSRAQARRTRRSPAPGQCPRPPHDHLPLRPARHHGRRRQLTDNSMIKTQDLTKVYGELRALNNLTLELDEGDLFGYIGPNGSGKTTTMRILATLLQPTWGEASVCGYSIYTQPKDIRRIIGYMPDFFGVYDDMKVIEYLEFFAAAYRIKGPGRKKICNEVLDLVDLGYKREAFVDQPFPRHDAAAGPGPRALARPQGADPRRAGQRPGPAGADRDPQPAQGAPQDGQDDHGFQPYPARAGRRLQQGRHHREGRAAGQRQRART